MEETSSDQNCDKTSDEAHRNKATIKSSAKVNNGTDDTDVTEQDSGINNVDTLKNIASGPEVSSSAKQCLTLNEIPMQIDNSCSGMRKDDSGIYSEKSPYFANLKESDGELSESISESLEDNGMEDIGTDVDKGFVNNSMKNSLLENSKSTGEEKCVDSESKLDLKKVVESANNDLVGNGEVETAEETAGKCENMVQAGTSINTDSETTTDVAMESIDDGAVADIDTENSPDDSGDKSKSKAEDICDNDDLSQNEDETWARFIRKSVKIRANTRRLVDYEDSDEVDSDSASRPLGHRSYRKRKSDSDSDNNEVNSEGDTNRDSNTEHNVDVDANVDSTPVLVRHSALGSDLDMDSNSADSERGDEDDVKDEDKESSSDGDDSPVEVSSFGPPKHKWRALFDLRQRELGTCMYKEPQSFRKGVQGSLQMVKRFDLQFKMDHHEGCVNALHFNSIGTLLASGSDDLNIVIWDWLKNRPALVYDSGHRSNVFQSKFMPFSGDAHVVSCARDGQIRLADLSSTGVCKGTKKIAQHRGAAHKLALEMDSPHVVLSCGEDAVTYEIDLRNDKPNRLVTTREDDKKVAMYSIHSNPVNSNEFCLGGRDHFIRIYDKRKISEAVDDGLLKKYSPHHIASAEKNEMKANVTCACYNYNGTEVLGTYNDEDIYLFNNEHSDSADFIHRYRGHRNNQTVKGVNFYGPRSEFVVSGSDCGHIFLWDKDTENIVQFLEGDEGGVINVLEPHPFAPVLATSGLDHDVKIWAPTLQSPTKLKGLKKVTKRNCKEREDERTGDGAMVDGSMLWFIMHQLRRSRRRREREARAALGNADGDDTSDTLSDDDTTPSDSDDSDGGGPQDRLQCATS